MPLRRSSARRAVSAPPPTSGLAPVVGCSANFEGHPTIADGPLRTDLATFEAQLQAALGVSGKQFAGPHGYSGSSWPATFDASAVSWAKTDGYDYAFLNVKTGSFNTWANWAAGGWNAHCATFVNSVPDDVTLYFTVNHEGENDKGGTYGGPADDGGVWEAQYAPLYSQGFAQTAEVVTALNRPNVWLVWTPMGVTFPTSGQLGDLGIKQRDPEKWQPYKHMTAAERARTPLCPDMYTRFTSATVVENFATKCDRMWNYAVDAGFGNTKIGLFEHTINRDAGPSDAAAATAWNDIFAYLRSLGDRLFCYLHFNTSDVNGASGTAGWVEGALSQAAFCQGVRSINFAAPPSGGAGIAVRAVATATDANDANPAIVIPAAAQVGDYMLVQYGGTTTRTPTNPAGWTVHVSQDSGNERARWYGKKLASGEPGSTLSVPLDGITRWFMTGVVYSGQHATTPIDGTVGVASDNVSQTTHAAGSATSTGAGRMIVTACWQRSGSIGGVNTGTTAWQPPAGYTPRTSKYAASLPGSTGAVADLSGQGAGTYGPNTWTSDAALPSFVGATLVLVPA